MKLAITAATLAFCLTAPFAGGAQAMPEVDAAGADTDTLSMSLREAILTAFDRNPTVAVQRLDPKISETSVMGASAEFYPQLSLSASASRSKNERFLGSQPEPFVVTSDRQQYDLSVSETLPTGTSISASAGFSASLSSIYTDQYVGELGVTVTQSLLQGLGTGYNLANLRKARIDVDISTLELKGVAEGITADVEKAYWNLFLARQEIDIQRRSLDLAQKQLSESVERIAVGKLAKFELASVQAEVATRQEALIDAESAYEQARLQFLYLLNPPGGRNWDVIPLTSDRPVVPADSLESVAVHEELALKYRPDLLQARLNLEKNSLDLARTKNGLLPRLDLFVTLGKTSYARSFGESVPDLGSPYYDVTGGINFDFPLFNRQARADHARTKYSREQLEISLSNMERLVQRDVRSAYVEVLRSREQIEATKVARDLEEKKTDAELEKYRVGKSTNYLVLQAQRDLIQSQLNEAGAKVAYLEALVDLYQMEGTLLERRGLQTPGDAE
jgi:outer membrane protein